MQPDAHTFAEQKSTGNVRVKCTNNGVENCGLMQAYNTTDSYNPKNMQGSITKMIQDGTQGTAGGPGLVQYFNDAKDTAGGTGGNLYKVMREYNSGKLNPADLSQGLGSTNSYVSDIANRLQGWNGWGSGGANCKW
jgi:glucan 1,3-beta-glucosidase